MDYFHEVQLDEKFNFSSNDINSLLPFQQLWFQDAAASANGTLDFSIELPLLLLNISHVCGDTQRSGR